MKSAIVTGGTKGIGKAITEVLLKKEYFVYVTYGSDDYVASQSEIQFKNISPNVKILKIDQSTPSNIREIKRNIGDIPIECIVCNAGATLRKKLCDITNDDWMSVFNIGLNSHFYLIRDLWDNIQLNSRIIFIGSMMAVFPHSMSIAYGTMKSAVHGLALNLVKEFEGTGTTVNVIAPGFVDTEWQKGKSLEIKENICRKTALGRFAQPSEIADVVNFILNNSFVNGSVIEISGGYCYK